MGWQRTIPTGEDQIILMAGWQVILAVTKPPSPPPAPVALDLSLAHRYPCTTSPNLADRESSSLGTQRCARAERGEQRRYE